MQYIANLNVKDIDIEGKLYSLSDIKSRDISLEIKKMIIDSTKITPEIFKYIFEDTLVEDALIIYIADKLGHCVLDDFHVMLRLDGGKAMNPLETAVLQDASDDVVLALSSENKALAITKNENVITKSLRFLIGLLFPVNKLDELEKEALKGVESQTIKERAKVVRARVNEKITAQTEPIFLEQPTSVMIIDAKEKNPTL